MHAPSMRECVRVPATNIVGVWYLAEGHFSSAPAPLLPPAPCPLLRASILTRNRKDVRMSQCVVFIAGKLRQWSSWKVAQNLPTQAGVWFVCQALVQRQLGHTPATPLPRYWMKQEMMNGWMHQGAFPRESQCQSTKGFGYCSSQMAISGFYIM